MDGSKGAFSSPFPYPCCMCGPTFEVNIFCLLPILPAVSYSWNFMQSQMRPHSNTNIPKLPFSLSWINTILLWGHSWMSCCRVYPAKLDSSCASLKKLFVNSFILVCSNNSHMGIFKPGPKSGHASVELFHEFVLIAMIRVANVIHWSAWFFISSVKAPVWDAGIITVQPQLFKKVIDWLLIFTCIFNNTIKDKTRELKK